jgi:hypothetical protein
LIDQPFGHLNGLVANVGDLPLFSTEGDLKRFAQEMLEEGVRTVQDTKARNSIREVIRERDPFRVPSMAKAAFLSEKKSRAGSINTRKNWIGPLLAWACIKAANRLREEAQACIEGLRSAAVDADPNLHGQTRVDLLRLQHQFQECCKTAKEINPVHAKSYNALLRQPFPRLNRPTPASRSASAG